MVSMAVWMAGPAVMNGVPEPPRKLEIVLMSPWDRAASHKGVGGRVQHVSEAPPPLSSIPNDNVMMSSIPAAGSR